MDLVPVRVYAKLFSGTYLSRKRVRIPYFADLVDFFVWEKMEKNGIIVYSLDEELRFHISDIAEKIGFMLLSYDIMIDSVKKSRSFKNISSEEERVNMVRQYYKTNKFRNDKYYLYNFIVYTKATLDSIAVTLNSFFGFGFRKGQIDLGKGAFVIKLESSLKEFSNFSKIYSNWINEIIEYRDAVIHQKKIDLHSRGDTIYITKHPLSWDELDRFRNEYLETNDDARKRELRKYSELVCYTSFMNHNIKNILAITSLASNEVLKKLKIEHSQHKPSHTYYYG